jgi:ESCRT-II complex subunit VPS25
MEKLRETYWQYDFPPFFTLQPNEKTRFKQLDSWCDLVLSYCKQNRIFELDIYEAQNTDLFSNKKIDRKLTIEFIQIIVDELKKLRKAEWLDSVPDAKQKHQQTRPRKCLVLWHTVDEWAKLIYDYVCKASLQNTVCTFYELIESDDVRHEEFYKISVGLLKKALFLIQLQHKAEIFIIGDGSEGVKFF